MSITADCTWEERDIHTSNQIMIQLTLYIDLYANFLSCPWSIWIICTSGSQSVIHPLVVRQMTQVTEGNLVIVANYSPWNIVLNHLLLWLISFHWESRFFCYIFIFLRVGGLLVRLQLDVLALGPKGFRTIIYTVSTLNPQHFKTAAFILHIVEDISFIFTIKINHMKSSKWHHHLKFILSNISWFVCYLCV